MNLKKAVEIGELNIKQAGKQMPADTLVALKLLVEAGKVIKNWRQLYKGVGFPLLPGETE